MIRPVLALAALLALGALAHAGDYRPPAAAEAWAGVTPACADGKMVGDIVNRFAWAQQRTFANGYRIAGFDFVRETRHANGPGLIERRYCEAGTTLNNGERTMVFYMIESSQGFVGLGSRVEFCVEGFDPWRVHDGWCRTVRPQ